MSKMNPSENFVNWERRQFEAFMVRVDKAISDKCEGMTSADLPDWLYWDDFTSGIPPWICANRAIRNAGGY